MEEENQFGGGRKGKKEREKEGKEKKRKERKKIGENEERKEDLKLLPQPLANRKSEFIKPRTRVSLRDKGYS